MDAGARWEKAQALAQQSIPPIATVHSAAMRSDPHLRNALRPHDALWIPSRRMRKCAPTLRTIRTLLILNYCATTLAGSKVVSPTCFYLLMAWDQWTILALGNLAFVS
jgi:hypothetical protein